MHALMLALVIDAPTPSPTISPLPSPIVQWYAQRGAEESGLDPALVRAVIDAESGGDPKAVSKAGAVGLMQLAASTAGDCGIHNRFDPLENVECGAKTLGYLVRHYGVATGIAAYNFGSGDVDLVGDHLSKMPVETQTYVKDVIEDYDALQHDALEAQTPDAGTSPAPVTQFDQQVDNAQAGCDALGELRLFVPFEGGALVAEVFSGPSDPACRKANPRPHLDGLALLASLERSPQD
jgi:hypothetical protein